MRCIKVAIDGGKFTVAKNEIEVVIENVMVPGEDDGEIHIKATHEGVITDVWVTRDEPLDTNIGTEAEMYEELAERLSENNT